MKPWWSLRWWEKGLVVCAYMSAAAIWLTFGYIVAHDMLEGRPPWP